MARKTTAAMISQKDGTDQKAAWFEQLQQSLASLDGQLMLMLSLSEWRTDETRHVHLGVIQGGRDVPTGRKEYCNSLGINSAQLNGEVTYLGKDKVNIPMKDLYSWTGPDFSFYGGPVPASPEKNADYRHNPGEMTNLTFPLSSGQYVRSGKPVLLWNGYQLQGRKRMHDIPNRGECYPSLELVLIGDTVVSDFFGIRGGVDTRSLFLAYAKSQGYDKALLKHWRDSLRQLEKDPLYKGKYCNDISPDAQDIIKKIEEQDLPCRVTGFDMHSKLGIPKPKELPQLSSRLRI